MEGHSNIGLLESLGLDVTKMKILEQHRPQLIRLNPNMITDMVQRVIDEFGVE
jgi:hypothetical protein